MGLPQTPAINNITNNKINKSERWKWRHRIFSSLIFWDGLIFKNLLTFAWPTLSCEHDFIKASFGTIFVTRCSRRRRCAAILTPWHGRETTWRWRMHITSLNDEALIMPVLTCWWVWCRRPTSTWEFSLSGGESHEPASSSSSNVQYVGVYASKLSCSFFSFMF